ncbi:MAG TPA: PAS domain-containing protein [Candidatus Limiplasma sp.]|nr:PAS domain-containing protein [Candidatus Limiplasma sp.]
MSRTAANLYDAPNAPFDPRHSDEHLQLELERFADQVENRLQSKLVSELMAGYASISAQMEEKNRQLAASDATRLEAQKIALLGNWDVDLASQAITWSETMYSILEIDPGVTPEMNLFMTRVHPDDLDATRLHGQELLQGKVYPELPYRLLMPDGRVKWVLARHVSVQDSRGKTVSVHGTLQDISTVKQAEAILQSITIIWRSRFSSRYGSCSNPKYPPSTRL